MPARRNSLEAPAQPPRDRDHPAADRALRAAGLCVATGAVVIVAGGDAFWVCVPGALLAAGLSARAAEAAIGAGLVVVAASIPTLAAPSLARALPALPLALLVPATSVAILLGVRRRMETERETLRTSSLTDPLTGVANRRALFERIDYEILRHARQRRSFAVLMLDLDGFKLVNDRFGHPAGDEVLRDVAAALHSVVRDQDTIARMGGDEFCVLAPETNADGAARLAARAEAAIARATAGLEALGVSVGIALFERDGADRATLLQHADAAQAETKRNRYRRAMRPRRAA